MHLYPNRWVLVNRRKVPATGDIKKYHKSPEILLWFPSVIDGDNHQSYKIADTICSGQSNLYEIEDSANKS